MSVNCFGDGVIDRDGDKDDPGGVPDVPNHANQKVQEGHKYRISEKSKPAFVDAFNGRVVDRDGNKQRPGDVPRVTECAPKEEGDRHNNGVGECVQHAHQGGAVCRGGFAFKILVVLVIVVLVDSNPCFSLITLLRGAILRISYKAIKRDFKNTRDGNQVFGIGERFATFPFGDRLTGDPKALCQLLLREGCALSQFI